MAGKTGADCKLYYNTATWVSPTWSEIKLTRDLTLNMQRAEADLSNRGGGGFKQILTALLDAGIEVELVWDPSNTPFSAIQDAFLNNTPIELAVADGDIETAGTEYLHADCVIPQFNRAEPLEGAVVANATIKVAYSSNTPEWGTVSS